MCTYSSSKLRYRVKMSYSQKSTSIWLVKTTVAHPVVGEVLVDYLPHLCLLGVEDVRGKVEDDVEHAGLCC